jgi:hypothetical protein
VLSVLLAVTPGGLGRFIRTNFSNVRAFSVFCPEYEGSVFLLNVGRCVRTSPHDLTAPGTNINTFTAVRTASVVLCDDLTSLVKQAEASASRPLL